LPLEVLATIDFLLQENKNISEQALIKEIHSWSDRKAKLFKEEYIKIALQHLKNNQSHLSFHLA
jgi:hypothetical protein